MSKWKHINLVYLYDETFEGFLSVVFDCYKNKTTSRFLWIEQ